MGVGVVTLFVDIPDDVSIRKYDLENFIGFHIKSIRSIDAGNPLYNASFRVLNISAKYIDYEEYDALDRSFSIQREDWK